MEWINIHAPVIRSPEYIGGEPVARATWLNVLVYCCEQENGGIIKGAAKWKDRQWQQTCGVMLSEVLESSPLLTVKNEDVIVWNYPVEAEEKVIANRKNGKKGGRPRKPQENPDKTQQKPHGLANNNHVVNPDKTTCPTESKPHGKTKGKDKERERKEKKRNNNKHCPHNKAKTYLENRAKLLLF